MWDSESASSSFICPALRSINHLRVQGTVGLNAVASVSRRAHLTADVSRDIVDVYARVGPHTEAIMAVYHGSRGREGVGEGGLFLVLFVLLNLDLASARRFTKALRPSRSTQTTLTQDPRTIYEQYDPSYPCSCPRFPVFPIFRLRHSPYHHSHFATSPSQPSSPSSACLSSHYPTDADSIHSLNLAFLTSVLFPRQKRVMSGSQLATSSLSYSSHGKL